MLSDQRRAQLEALLQRLIPVWREAYDWYENSGRKWRAGKNIVRCQGIAKAARKRLGWPVLYGRVEITEYAVGPEAKAG